MKVGCSVKTPLKLGLESAHGSDSLRDEKRMTKICIEEERAHMLGVVKYVVCIL